MQNILPNQTLLINELQGNDPTLAIEWDEVRGVAAFIRGVLSRPLETTPENVIQSFLAKFGGLFGSSDLDSRLKLLRSRTDDLGWRHLEYQQTHYTNERPNDMFDVYGSKLVAHFTADGTLTEVQSSCWREISLNLEQPMTIEELHKILTKRVVNAPGFRQLQAHLQQYEKNFPIMQIPRLVIYPWQGGFRLTWTTYAFGIVDVKDPSGKPTGAKGIELGQVFVDALTGEQFIFAPTRIDLETPDSGSGLSAGPLKGPFSTRPLKIVHVDTTSTYRLRDTTHQGLDPRQGRDIITYDTQGAKYLDIPDVLRQDKVPVSEDTDGDKNWSRVPADTTDTERTASQQPEVDAHYLCGKIYEWYYALGKGRAGWDNNEYGNPPVPPQPVRALTHAYDKTTTRSPSSYYNKGLSNGNWYAFLAFSDGDPTQKCITASGKIEDTGFGYFSGSEFIVAHEYQHAITDFSFIDGAGAPGLTYGGWLAAVHEGLSDVFGCFFSKSWAPGPEISYNGMVFRNLAFPRDSLSWCNRTGSAGCGFANKNLDHFDDRGATSTYAHMYDRGTILAHCAYLMGQGGVQQRAVRKPILIPVYGLGNESRFGINVLKSARIWYHALTYYFSTHGVLTDNPKNDETSFRTLRNACESAAIGIYKANSNEHRTTVLAFYAVGFIPGISIWPSYGPDVTFLRWGADWWMSRPYVGIHSPDWSSMDLFINNGGRSEWNAMINLIDVTKFENTVYCRVRNIGDEDAENVQVEFFYAKAGTGVTTWLPIKDSKGNIQRLTVGTLGPGQSNFLDSDQNDPPALAGVKWYIPPLAAGESVNHFCIKAIATCTNDVNKYNNEVQSNIIYVPYIPEGFKIAFTAGNPKTETIPLELHVDAALPKRWNASIQEPTSQISLEPGEERTFQIGIDMPKGADQQLDLPLDGEVKGQVFGSISGPITGTITETTMEGDHFRGHISAYLSNIGILEGSVDGSVNISTGQINGKIMGMFQSTGEIDTKSESLSIGVEACLRPLRRVNISQTINGEQIGGITIQIQVPIHSGPCTQELPPTDPLVNP